MKRITLEEAIALFNSDTPEIHVEVNAHWSYHKKDDTYWYSYWCCDPSENCGSDECETYKSKQALLDDLHYMWGRLPTRPDIYQYETSHLHRA